MGKPNILNTLHDLLERERATLLSGQFSKLEQIAGEKSRVLTQITPLQASAELTKLREMAQRNARLLTAAQRGLDGARDRLNAIQNRGSDLNTYDKYGHTMRPAQSGTKLMRRA